LVLVGAKRLVTKALLERIDLPGGLLARIDRTRLLAPVGARDLAPDSACP
jgi:hypothetical protein